MAAGAAGHPGQRAQQPKKRLDPFTSYDAFGGKRKSGDWKKWLIVMVVLAAFLAEGTIQVYV